MLTSSRSPKSLKSSIYAELALKESRFLERVAKIKIIKAKLEIEFLLIKKKD
jgi:hypothetical protein